MSISTIGMVGALVILLVAIVDARRGKTGMLAMRLTKEETPDKFWAAVVLYFNLAFLLYWLSGQAYEPPSSMVCDPNDGTCSITIEAEAA